MSKQVPLPKEQVLAERLRRDAIESRPEFSESLHRRIADAVRQQHATEVVVGTRVNRRRRGLAAAVAAAVAAACLLCAVVGWRLIEDARQQETARASVEQVRLIAEWTDQATTRFDGLVASVSLKPEAAKLQHDARLVANAILEPLPIDAELVSDP
jgi:hypothetical protein